METEYTKRKIEAASLEVEKLLAVLNNLPGKPWVNYFERIKDSILLNDVENIVKARDSIPFGTMGGFGEFLEATPEIQPFHRELSDLIGDLKLHLRYGVTRERNHE